MLTTIIIVGFVAVILGVIAYVRSRDPFAPDWVEEHIDALNSVAMSTGISIDPLGDGFTSARDFLAWAEVFENTVYLDGLVVAPGVEPAVHFITHDNGRITLK